MKFLTELHQAICTTLKKEIPAIQTCETYPVMNRSIKAPAVFVELESLEPGIDPGTEELALKGRFEARIVIDSTIKNAFLIVRSLAIEVARVVNRNTWGINVSPAELLLVERDELKPELNAYLVWLVEWEHEMHIGESVWVENDIQPHTLNVGEISVGK